MKSSEIILVSRGTLVFPGVEMNTIYRCTKVLNIEGAPFEILDDVMFNEIFDYKSTHYSVTKNHWTGYVITKSAIQGLCLDGSFILI